MKRKIIRSGILYAFLIVTTAVLFSCSKGDGGQRVVDQPEDPPEDTDTTPPEEIETLFLFNSKTQGYNCYRIPAIIQTKKGTLLAFAEARKRNCSDAGDINLVMKRSDDKGETWSEMQVIWDDGINTCGNPVPIIDQSTGRIFLIMNWNWTTDTYSKIVNKTSEDTRRVYMMYSDDDGLTWSTPKDITKSAKMSSWTWHSAGPCHGIQLRKGKFKGRLIAPCSFVEAGSKKSYAYVIYSDDHGQTWQIGKPYSKAGAGESSVAERSDGSLMLNMRSNTGLRFVATSNDGGVNWTAFDNYKLIDPACQGSLLSYPGGSDNYLFFSNPSSTTKRENMKIQMSTDGGKNWDVSYPVHKGPAGYSDMVMLSDTTIGILYEWGDGESGYHERIAFENISISAFQ